MTTVIAMGIHASIFLFVFCLGLGANLEERLYLFHRPWLAVRSLLSMNIVMPLVAAALALAFDLHPAVKITLIALAVSPVPPILPKKQLKAGGSAEYIFGLLLFAALFSIAFAPAALVVLGGAFGKSVHIPPGAIAKIVFSTVLIPLGAGMAIRYAAREFAERVQQPLSKLATLLLVACLVPVLFVAWKQIVSLLGNGTLVAIVLFCTAGLITGHLLGGPESRHRTVLALSTASRHPGVAIAIANIAFPQEKPLVVVAVLLTVLVGAIASTVYLAWWERAESNIRSRRAA